MHLNVTCILILVETFGFAIALVIILKKFSYRAAKEHYLVKAVMGFGLLVLYTLFGIEHLSKKETLQGIADNILSGAVFVIVCLLFSHIEKLIKNRYEDSEKLTQDYKGLSEIYSGENLLRVSDNITYPIINIGECNISMSGDAVNIVIRDDDSSEYMLPGIIENNMERIISCHDTSSVYNNICIRAKKLVITCDGKIEITTERTMYYNSLVTNRACDFKFAADLSVRGLFEPGPTMTPLDRSKLSNHMGFNGFVESDDGLIVFVKRNKDVSIAKKTYGTSIGASLKSKYALEDGHFTYNGLKKGIIEELNDELKIDSDYIIQESLRIIALYRDCVECGKPQFLIYVRIRKSAKDITDSFVEQKRLKKRKWWKHFSKDYKEDKVLEDGEKLIWVSKTDLINYVRFYYDGIGFDGGVLSYDNNWNTKKIDELKMVPSASASVSYFVNYVKNGN